MTVLRQRRFFWLILAFLALSCVGNIVGSGEVGELEKNRQKWRDAEITSYTFRLNRSCFCGFFGPADITVVNGQIVAVRQFSPETVDIAPESFQFFDTVEGLFDTVAEAIAQDAHQLDVTYDEQLGFPSRIAIDYIENAIDDEITFTAAAVVPIVN